MTKALNLSGEAFARAAAELASGPVTQITVAPLPYLLVGAAVISAAWLGAEAKRPVRAFLAAIGLALAFITVGFTQSVYAAFVFAGCLIAFSGLVGAARAPLSGPAMRLGVRALPLALLIQSVLHIAVLMPAAALASPWRASIEQRIGFAAIAVAPSAFLIIALAYLQWLGVAPASVIAAISKHAPPPAQLGPPVIFAGMLAVAAHAKRPIFWLLMVATVLTLASPLLMLALPSVSA